MNLKPLKKIEKFTLDKIEQQKKIKILSVVFMLGSISLFAQTNNFPVNGDALLNTTINETPGAITNSSSIIFRSSGHAIDGRSRFQYWKMQGVGRSSWGSGDLAFYSKTDGAGYKEIFRLSNSGNVGIGTNDPKERFQIGTAFVFHDGGHKILAFHYKPGGDEDLDTNKYAAEIRFDPINGLLRLGTSSSLTAAPTTRLSISNEGNIGIGTTAPDSKLTVKGNIHAQEVKVDLAGVVAPDYVFKEDYDLKTLEEVESHIQKEGHLPNIPSAEKMEEDGINLKEMNLKLLEKIEELTLYTIKQEKRIEKLEREIIKQNRM